MLPIKSQNGEGLYAATVKTATREIIIIAFAIIHGNEDGQGWRYFCSHLETACSVLTLPHPIERVTYNLFTFVSDRDKGLIESLDSTFPHNHATHCAIHLQRNVETKFDIRSARREHSIAGTFSKRLVLECLHEMEEINEGARAYLEAVPINSWCSTAWLDNPTLPPRYGIITTNMSESMNNMLSDARDGSWFETIDFIMCKIISRASTCRALYRQKRGLVQEWVTILEQRWENGVGFQVHEVNNQRFLFLVEGPTTGNYSTTRHHTINIQERTCSCGQWQEHDVPCIDACAYYRLREQKTINYVKNTCSEFYKYSSVSAVFLKTFTPVIAYNLSNDGVTKPTRISSKRRTGRPKFQRLRNRQKGIKKLQIICSKYNEEGHNARTCDARAALKKQRLGNDTISQELDLS